LVPNGETGLIAAMQALNMHVIFRADASQAIGSGHVTRCATLAGALREAGATVRFLCRDLPGHYAGWLRQLGYEVVLLPAPREPLPAAVEQYARWLGVSVAEDAAQSLAALGDAGGDWLVVDHYALDATWERELGQRVPRVLVIDDLADRAHDCALLLDQNYHAAGAARYARLAPDAELLLGPQFALLRPDFAACRAVLRPRSGEVGKLLVFFGGSDAADVSSTVLRALAATGRRELAVDVVAGQANSHLEALGALCVRIGARLHTQVDDMAARMAAADLAFGAAGVATWERAALGLPTLAVSVADNQREIARYADALGLLRWLGDAADVSEAAWAAAIDWACSEPGALHRQSVAGMETVDGRGARRVVERIHAHQRRLH
jgi:UDP-2,4-diacetamido-2,4,6-trideoxy-beta-L-altropyranose hydrolase